MIHKINRDRMHKLLVKIVLTAGGIVMLLMTYQTIQKIIENKFGK